jgi:hypothetical protein
MALTDLQMRIMRRLSANRSQTSYLAGGVILNLEWPRRSDDIDIFHDSDEAVSDSALKDIADLQSGGFHISVDVKTWGLFEATVSDDGSSTTIQWMSETRVRFFPLVKDEQWGLRLHQSDLAVNKVLAAASRRKGRDFADIVAISENMCPLGPLVMAAAGKPPSFSPQKIVEQIRWHAQSIPDEDYNAIKGLPESWTAHFIRDAVTRQTDLAEDYISRAPIEVVGVLAVNAQDMPVEVTAEGLASVILRKATAEPEVMPQPAGFGATSWGKP